MNVTLYADMPQQRAVSLLLRLRPVTAYVTPAHLAVAAASSALPRLLLTRTNAQRLRGCLFWPHVGLFLLWRLPVDGALCSGLPYDLRFLCDYPS